MSYDNQYGQGQYPHPPRPPRYEPSDVQQQKAGMFRAFKWSAWVWAAVTVLPILGILGCCGLCMFGGVLGSVTPTPTP